MILKPHLDPSDFLPETIAISHFPEDDFNLALEKVLEIAACRLAANRQRAMTIAAMNI